MRGKRNQRPGGSNPGSFQSRLPFPRRRKSSATRQDTLAPSPKHRWLSLAFGAKGPNRDSCFPAWAEVSNQPQGPVAPGQPSLPRLGSVPEGYRLPPMRCRIVRVARGFDGLPRDDAPRARSEPDGTPIAPVQNIFPAGIPAVGWPSRNLWLLRQSGRKGRCFHLLRPAARRGQWFAAQDWPSQGDSRTALAPQWIPAAHEPNPAPKPATLRRWRSPSSSRKPSPRAERCPGRLGQPSERIRGVAWPLRSGSVARDSPPSIVEPSSRQGRPSEPSQSTPSIPRASSPWQGWCPGGSDSWDLAVPTPPRGGIRIQRVRGSPAGRVVGLGPRGLGRRERSAARLAKEAECRVPATGRPAHVVRASPETPSRQGSQLGFAAWKPALHSPWAFAFRFARTPRTKACRPRARRLEGER